MDAIGAIAHGVQRQSQRLETQGIEHLDRHGDRLHIGTGIAAAQQLRPNLVKLALPSSLGPLVAKHRAAVPQALDVAGGQQFVLNHRSHHPRRSFRAQRERSRPAIAKGVHLLAHHIGRLANAPRKQLRLLKNGGANLPKGSAIQMGAGDRLHPLPSRRLLGQ